MSALDDSSIEAAVIAAIRTQQPGAGNMTRETPLFEGGLELTSLRFFRVVGEVEENFGVAFDDADLTALADATIGELCALTSTRLAPVAD